MGTAPAPGAADRRPRGLALKGGESPNGELECTLAKVAGEGAGHCARGGRAPFQLNGSRFRLPRREHRPMLQRKRCVPFGRVAYAGGSIKMRAEAFEKPAL